MEQYLVWRPDSGSSHDDGLTFLAHDPNDAACKWARREDHLMADSWIAAGGVDVNVIVRDPNGVDHARIVSGVSVAQYRARTAPVVVLAQGVAK